MSVFGWGAFLGGAAQRTQERMKEAEQWKMLSIQNGAKAFNTEVTNYKKNKAIRQAKIQTANDILKQSTFSSDQVIQAGDVVGWKSQEDILKYLRENFIEPERPQGDRLAQDTQNLFGPEPQAPTPTDFIPTAPERKGISGGLLDVFSPRKLPSEREVNQMLGFTPEQTRQTGQTVSVGPAGSTGSSGPGLKDLKRKVSTEDINTIEDRFRNEGLFPRIGGRDGEFNANLQPINELNSAFRSFATQLAVEGVSRGQDVNTAMARAEDRLASFSNSEPFQNIMERIQAGGDITETPKISRLRKDEKGNVILDEKGKPKTNPLFKDMENVLLEFNNDPDIFESAVRAFSTIADENAVDIMVDDANGEWLIDADNYAKSRATNQEEYNSILKDQIYSLAPRRRREVQTKLAGWREELQTTGSLEFPEPNSGEMVGLTAPTSPVDILEEKMPLEATVEPGVTVTEETPTLSSEGAATQELSGLISEPTQRSMKDYITQSAKSLVDSMSPENLKKSIKNVLGDAYAMDLKLLNAFSDEGQLVATKLIKAAEKRGKMDSKLSRNMLSAKFRGDPDDETLEGLITENEGGFHAKVYEDSTGHKTIGIGFNVDRPGAEQTLAEVVGETAADDIMRGRRELKEEEAQQLLAMDIAEATNDAKRIVKGYDELPERIQKVLVDLTYNVGEGDLRGFKKFLAAVENKDWEVAIEELLDSNYAFQTGARAINNAMLIAKELKENG